jgi:sugar transferase (PEP-CTERM/EpsH1 system associated)
MIAHLSRSHEVTVASLVRSDEEAAEVTGFEKYCHRYLMEQVHAIPSALRMAARLPTPVPSSMGYFYSPLLASRIRAELSHGHYDLIFVHCSSVAQYVEHVVGIPKILDFGDMDSQKWLEYARTRCFPFSLGYWLEGTKLMYEEKRLASRFDYCSCTTRAELETLRGYQVDTPSIWFPNGVDHQYFYPAGEPYDPDAICFIGRMDYYPNQECMIAFCRDVLPLLRQRRPGIKLWIIGADPSPEIRRLGEIPGVTVTGSVKDVRPFVQRAALSVAPLNIARGTQNKILEAMAMGVPVVASSRAAGGIDAIAGEHFLQADSPPEYTEAILHLLEQPQERARYAQAGWERVCSHHDWKASMARLDKLIEDCLVQYRWKEEVDVKKDGGVI